MRRSRTLDALVTLAAIVAVSLTLHAVSGDVFPGDLATARHLQDVPGGRFAEPVADFAYLSPVLIVVLVTGFVLAIRARAYALAAAVVLVGLATTASPILKDLIDRPRPWPGELVIREPGRGSGYPSGHALVSMLAYGYMAYAAVLHAPGAARRYLLSVAAGAILLIGWGRMYDGAHWPSDVYGGWGVGIVLLAASVWVTHLAARWLRG